MASKTKQLQNEIFDILKFSDEQRKEASVKVDFIPSDYFEQNPEVCTDAVTEDDLPSYANSAIDHLMATVETLEAISKVKGSVH